MTPTGSCSFAKRPTVCTNFCSNKLDEFRLIEPMPRGKLLNADDSVFLTPEQIAELRRFHRDTNRHLRYGKQHQTKVCAFNEIESPALPEEPLPDFVQWAENGSLR